MSYRKRHFINDFISFYSIFKIDIKNVKCDFTKKLPSPLILKKNKKKYKISKKLLRISLVKKICYIHIYKQ